MDEKRKGHRGSNIMAEDLGAPHGGSQVRGGERLMEDLTSIGHKKHRKKGEAEKKTE